MFQVEISTQGKWIPASAPTTQAKAQAEARAWNWSKTPTRIVPRS